MPSNAQYVSDYLEYARTAQGRSADTVYKYGLSLRHLVRHLDQHHLTLSSATAEDLRCWAHAPLLDGRAPSASTVKVKTCTMRSLYAYLTDIREATRVNTARKLHVPTVHNDNPKPAPEEGWVALWDSELSLSDRVAFGLGYFCGLRRHEVTLLRPRNFVDLPKPRLVDFKRKGGKKAGLPFTSCALFYEKMRPDLIGGSASTFLDAVADLRTARRAEVRLLSWREEQVKRPSYVVHPMPDDYINPNAFNEHLAAALTEAGVRQRFSPHQLRHGFGTNMVGMGLPLLQVSRLMGHASVTQTAKYVMTPADPFDDYLGRLEEESGEVAIPSPHGG